jgi:AAA15 family ATPase/GTPase
MDSIKIERLRCLSDTGFIELKPITVLLGQNSSGKSTFLRVFPLLKQSVESRTTGPILWNGRLVDFGGYEDAHQNDSDEDISFSFKFKIESSESNSAYIDSYYPIALIDERYRKILHDVDIYLRLQVARNKKKKLLEPKNCLYYLVIQQFK